MMYQFRAHAGDPISLIPVMPGNEEDACFGFHVPTSGLMYISGTWPIMDNTTILQNSALFIADVPQVDGAEQICPYGGPSGELVTSWDAESDASNSIPDAGLSFGSGDFILEAHYVNATSNSAYDTSGFAVCACGG